MTSVRHFSASLSTLLLPTPPNLTPLRGTKQLIMASPVGELARLKTLYAQYSRPVAMGMDALQDSARLAEKTVKRQLRATHPTNKSAAVTPSGRNLQISIALRSGAFNKKKHVYLIVYCHLYCGVNTVVLLFWEKEGGGV